MEGKFCFLLNLSAVFISLIGLEACLMLFQTSHNNNANKEVFGSRFLN